MICQLQFSSQFIHSVEKDFESFKDVGAVLRPDGSISWFPPFILQTSCRINARLFPFDTQHCTLTFASWAYNIELLDLKGSPDASRFQKYFVENGIWELQYLTLEKIFTDYGDSGG